MAGGKAYEMAFRLNAKLGSSYNSTFAKAENVAKKAFSSIAKIGAAVMGGIGIADIANTYKDFQQSMANTGAIAGVSKSSEGFKALENAALEAGRTTSKTAKEAADALGYMSLAGWTTQQSISGLMPVLRLSEASGADLATTSDLVTDSMSAMGIATSDLSKYLDIAANANNKTNQTATQMLETFIGAGGMFKELGTSMEEAAALSGVLANRGIKGSEGATSLNSILINLMGNSKSSAEALEKLGVSAYDSNGKFRGVTTTLKDISAAMKNASDEDRGWFLSKLGGKTQIDTLNALLSGIETLGENGKSEVENLTAAFKESGGALEEMSKRMNDTFSGALAILGSATDDVKIQIMKELEPTITPIIRKIADALPGLGTKIAGFFKSMVRKGKALWNDLKPVFSWIVENFDNIKVGIAAMGGAFVGAKIVDKIKNIANAVKGFASACKANPILLVVEAVAALGFAAYEAHEQMKKANLEEHFGNISLTAEEMDRVVGQIFKSKNLEHLREQMEKFSALEPLSEKINEDLKIIEKTDWKLSVGMKLTVDEQEEYKTTVNSYIADVRAYFEQAFQADWTLFEGHPEIQEAIREFYKGQSDELNRLGAELKEALERGFADNVLELDEEREILNIMNQMKKIKEGLAQSEYETSMISLQLEAKEKAELNGGYLTAETYNEIEEKAKDVQDEYKATIRTRRASEEYAIKRSFKEGSPEYEKAMAVVDTDYQSALAQINAGWVNFTTNTLDVTYGDELRSAQKRKDKEIEESAKGFDRYTYSVSRGSEHKPDFRPIESAIMDNYGIDKYSLENMRDIRNNADEYIKQLKEQQIQLISLIDTYRLNGTTIPKSLLDAKKDVDDALEKVKGIDSLISKDYNMNDIYTSIGRLIPKNERNDMLIANYENNYIRSGYNQEKSRRAKEAKENRETASEMLAIIPANLRPRAIKGPLQQAQAEARIKVNADVKAGKLDFLNFNKSLDTIFGKPVKATVTANAVTKAGVIDTTDFSRGVHNAASTPIETDVRTDVNVKAGNINTSGFVNQVHNTVNSLFSGIGVKVRVGADGKIEKYAKGTEYTPDTFIAGEKGAELITGAKGRKVFTALETSNIFSNIGRIKDMLLSAVGTVNIFDRIKGYDISEISGENEGMLQERIVKPSNTTNNNSNISITINNEIKIDAKDGKNDDNLKALIDEAMEENSKKIADLIRGIIEDNNVREMRLSNG